MPLDLADPSLDHHARGCARRVCPSAARSRGASTGEGEATAPVGLMSIARIPTMLCVGCAHDAARVFLDHELRLDSLEFNAFAARARLSAGWADEARAVSILQSANDALRVLHDARLYASVKLEQWLAEPELGVGTAKTPA